jgi:UDP-glucose 4-epimerase
VRQVIMEVERVLGARVSTIEAPRRAGDPPRLFAAPGLAERDLGWVATRSDIASIVESAARWRRWAIRDLPAVGSHEVPCMVEPRT